jgi:signal transduction histidine kinase
MEAVNKGQIFQYITKPWDKQEVHIVIEKALGESQLKSKNKHLIASLKESNTQLKSALKELDNFIYKASHDLMAPIATVLGLVNLSKMDISNEEQLNYINKIESTAKRMKYFLSHMALVNMVHDKTIELKEVQIGSFIIKYQSYSTEKFNIHIDKTDDVNCLTDDTLLNIALSQIVENSLKFSHPNKSGAAWIKASKTEMGILISVKDNGMGINEKYTDQYFNMFFKGGGSEGSGVGLFIARKVVEKLQGKIWITGGLNNGATVHILLPKRMADVISEESFLEAPTSTTMSI